MSTYTVSSHFAIAALSILSGNFIVWDSLVSPQYIVLGRYWQSPRISQKIRIGYKIVWKAQTSGPWRLNVWRRIISSMEVQYGPRCSLYKFPVLAWYSQRFSAEYIVTPVPETLGLFPVKCPCRCRYLQQIKSYLSFQTKGGLIERASELGSMQLREIDCESSSNACVNRGKKKSNVFE